MVLTELLQNAVEHGFGGRAPGTVDGRRASGGRPAARDRRRRRARAAGRTSTWTASTSLGLSIVRTLVESELGGTFEIGPGAGGGHAGRSLRRSAALSGAAGRGGL